MNIRNQEKDMLSNIKTFSQIGILTKSTRYQTHFKKIEEALYSKTSSSSNNHIATSIGLEENHDYQLILQSNDIIKEIDDEMILTTYTVQIFIHLISTISKDLFNDRTICWWNLTSQF